MAETGDIRTVALVCPECGEKLRAPRGDVVFACRGCGAVSEVTARGLEVVPCSWPVGPSGEDPARTLRIAYWCFHTDVRYGGSDEAGVEHLSRMVRPERVYVPAFRQRSVLAFGDMGLHLTYNPPGFTEGDPDTFSGATMGSGQASRFVAPMVLWRADQIHDVTNVSVDVRIGGIDVVALPARDEGKRIVDLIDGRQWPEASFLDVDALRFGRAG
ncbi:MAG: hypothetical protein JRG91_03285 [Deltaproteobacteria bacterium]|nr:hypothetical protein [Deltaproteobacteria bacterium]